MDIEEQSLRNQIKELVGKFYSYKFRKNAFVGGVDKLNYAGRVFDENEMIQSVDTLLDFTLTLSGKGTEFEKEISSMIGSRFSVLTNSGSSANLLAVTAMKSKR